MKNANLLDQFFLVDPKVVDGLISASELKKKDVVLEIGAGRGVLTKIIAAKAGKVIAVEIDKKFRKDLAGLGSSVRIIFADALSVLKNKEKYNLCFNKIVGSLPSSTIEPLMKILTKINFEVSVFLIPLKFVGTLKQSVYFDSKLICKVDRKSFSPVPKTNWALVKMVKKENLKKSEFLQKYVYEHPLAKKENALREGLISYYKVQGKKLTKNQARKMLLSEKLARQIGGRVLFKSINIYAAPILNIEVPQSGHLALRAGFPFFIVTLSGLETSFLARHFTQYIVAITFFHLPSKFYFTKGRTKFLSRTKYKAISKLMASMHNTSVFVKSLRTKCMG